MRRFRRRGLAKVAVEMLLAATAYNLTRLYHAAAELRYPSRLASPEPVSAANSSTRKNRTPWN